MDKIECRPTIKRVIDGLSNLTRNEKIDDETVVIWVDMVESNDIQYKAEGLVEGTILLGIMEPDGERGTLRICPEQINKRLC